MIANTITNTLVSRSLGLSLSLSLSPLHYIIAIIGQDTPNHESL